MAEFAVRLANGQDTAPRVRKADGLPFPSNGGTGARSGLRNDGGGAVTVLTGTMQVQVSPFAAWINGGVSDAQGGYPFVLDAAKTLTLDNGDATQTRTDVVGVQIREHAFDGSGATDAVLTVVKGIPGAGAPALPTTFLALRRVIVPAGASAGTGGLSASALSTDLRQYLPGGVMRVTGTAQRDALPVRQPGHVVYRGDTDRLEVWNGTAWKVYAPQADTGWLTLSAATGFTSAAQYRVINGIGFLKGTISKTTGNFANADVLANLPAELQATSALLTWGSYAASPVRLQIDTKLTVTAVPATIGATIGLQTEGFPVG